MSGLAGPRLWAMLIAVGGHLDGLWFSGIMGQGRACLACYIDTRWFSTSAVGRPLLRNLLS
jgi:hypothetical protein